MDYLLRTATKDDMVQALVQCGLAYSSSGFLDDAGVEVPASVDAINGASLDFIGEIPGKDSRFHANLRTKERLPIEVESMLPTFPDVPEVPYRKWF
jgi:hypothetical protein